MSAHTPGPWRFEKSHDGEEWGRGAWDLVAGEGRSRCVLASRAPWTSRAEESDANARLVSAAPDLLAALKAMVKVDAEDGTDDEYLRDARAAIDKAEGR